LPKLGETLVERGYSLTALQVKDPAEPGILYGKEEGKRLIAVEIIVGNVDGKPVSSNILNATLVDTDGFS